MIKCVFSIGLDIKRPKFSSENFEGIDFIRENEKRRALHLVLPKRLIAVNIIFVYVGRWLSLLLRSVVVVFVKVCNSINKQRETVSAIKSNQKYF